MRCGNYCYCCSILFRTGGAWAIQQQRVKVKVFTQGVYVCELCCAAEPLRANGIRSAHTRAHIYINKHSITIVRACVSVIKSVLRVPGDIAQHCVCVRLCVREEIPECTFGNCEKSRKPIVGGVGEERNDCNDDDDSSSSSFPWQQLNWVTAACVPVRRALCDARCALLLLSRSSFYSFHLRPFIGPRRRSYSDDARASAHVDRARPWLFDSRGSLSHLYSSVRSANSALRDILGGRKKYYWVIRRGLCCGPGVEWGESGWHVTSKKSTRVS